MPNLTQPTLQKHNGPLRNGSIKLKDRLLDCDVAYTGNGDVEIEDQKFQ